MIKVRDALVICRCYHVLVVVLNFISVQYVGNLVYLDNPAKFAEADLLSLKSGLIPIQIRDILNLDVISDAGFIFNH